LGFRNAPPKLDLCPDASRSGLPNPEEKPKIFARVTDSPLFGHAMKAKTIYRRWKRKTSRHLSNVPQLLRLSQRQGEPEQIHQLRVALRRVRLAVRIASPLYGRPVVDEFREWSRRVLDVAGPVRDCDVTLDWLRDRSSSVEVIDLITSRRRRSFKTLQTKLGTLSARIEKQLGDFDHGRHQRARLRKRFLKQLRAHQEYIFHDSSRFFALEVPEQHAFRRAVRRLRYLRELGVARRRQKDDRLLQQLARLHETMGEYQNRIVAAQLLHRFKQSTEVNRLCQLLGSETVALKKAIGRELKALDKIRNIAKDRNGTG
jgi:CHAD domain-containing protein